MSGSQWDQDDRKIARYFGELVEKYGNDVRSLDWGSVGSQTLRFSVLAGVGPLEGASVLDVGCGLGDFYGWLTENHIAVDYTGFDITPGMIDRARQRFPSARFEVAGVLDVSLPEASFDYVFCSGIFNFRELQPFDFLREVTTKMFRLSRKAIAFNSLSGWTERRDGTEFHADPLETVAFCRSLSPSLTLRHDYHPRDFTVYVYKKEKA